MANKINIAELLKDCPKGMELDCTMYENVEFDYIEQKSIYPIRCLMKTNGGYTSLFFTYNGCSDVHPNAKCVIFPKGKTTWEGFQKPFRDGDIITCTNSVCSFVAIFKEINTDTTFRRYASLTLDDSQQLWIGESWSDFKNPRLATEEEKEKLFDAIKHNGYEWNAETNTLEKLIKPKFKVGDIIQDIDTYKVKITEINIDDECYGYESMIAKGIGSIPFNEQNSWELLPNKFDITTLVPFESRVLARDNNNDVWRPAFWGAVVPKTEYNDLPFVVVGGCFYEQCIPYEHNQHLLGTTNDCDDFYKTWE